MSDDFVPVRARPVAVGAAALAAVYLFVIFVVRPVPGPLLRVFGAPDTPLAAEGGLRMTWMPPTDEAGVKQTEQLLARGGGERMRIRPHGMEFQIDVAGVKAVEIDEVATLMASEGALSFHEVVDAEAEMLKLSGILELYPRATPRPEVGIDIDQWTGNIGGPHRSTYLYAPTQAQLDEKLAYAREHGFYLPQGARIGYQREELDGGKVRWRTYVLKDVPAIDSSGIANATFSYDPNTGRPVVMLDFTREAAQVFGDLTGRIVGEKLAIVVGDTVRSAPVINDEIRGGRAMITLGAGDIQKQEREAKALISVLRAGALPRGGVVLSKTYIGPATEPAWIARGVIGAVGGALVGLVVLALVRVLAPVRRRAPRKADGAFPFGRLAVVLVAPAAAIGLSWIPVPGVGPDNLMQIIAQQVAPLNIKAASLGISSLLFAYCLAELVALVVPPWRRRRHRGPEARLAISYAALAIGIALVVIQSVMLIRYLDAIQLVRKGHLVEIEIVMTFLAAALVFTLVAHIIRDHGVGNGWGALLVGGTIVGLVRTRGQLNVIAGPPIDFAQAHAVAIATALAFAIPVIVSSRWRIVQPGEAPVRLLTSGIAPLSDAGGVVLVLSSIALMHVDPATRELYDVLIWLQRHVLAQVALVVVLSAVWSFAFARPSIGAALARKVGLTAASRRSWLRGLCVSSLLLVTVFGITQLSQTTSPAAVVLATPMIVMFAAAYFLDLWDDLRTRRVALERVWSLHQAQHADLVERALEQAGIPCVMSGGNLRALLAFFGPFVPIDVRVAPEHAPQARVLLESLLEE